MSEDTIRQRVRARYEEVGLVRLVGNIANYSGGLINERCQRVADVLEDVRSGEYPLSLVLRAFRQGFDPETYCWLDLTNRDQRQYINDASAFALANQDYDQVIDNKYAFHRFTSDHSDAIPRLYGVITGGEFRPLPGMASDLPALVDEHTEVVLKPIMGMQGRGFRKLERSGNQVAVNGTVRSREAVQKLPAEVSTAIVTEWIEQHRYSTAIYPKSTNTIRLVTVVDPETNRPHMIRACHRFGSSSSQPTDNWSQGGYVAPIDIADGRIKDIVTLDGRANRVYHDIHPETNSPVAGVSIPRWDDTVAMVEALADLHRLCPVVGWDVVVSPDGPVVIEANSEPGEILSQLETQYFTIPAS